MNETAYTQYVVEVLHIFDQSSTLFSRSKVLSIKFINFYSNQSKKLLHYSLNLLFFDAFVAVACMQY